MDEMQKLYDQYKTQDNMVHVQNFANEIRGQLTEKQELKVSDLFRTICKRFKTGSLKYKDFIKTI